MSVFVYVNTSNQVGDPDHLKVFANRDAADAWLAENGSWDERLPTLGSAQSVIQRAGGERIWNSLHPIRRSWNGFWPARS